MESKEIFQPKVTEDKSQKPSYMIELINKFEGYDNLRAHIDKKMSEAKVQGIEIGSNSSTRGFDFTSFVLGESADCMSKEKIEVLNQIINGMANEIDDVRSGLAAREPRKANNTERTKTEKGKSELAYAKGRQKKIEGEARMLGIDEDEI